MLLYVLPALAMPGPMELLLLVVVVMILFGAGKLPQVFTDLGKGIKALKDAQKDD